MITSPVIIETAFLYRSVLGRPGIQQDAVTVRVTTEVATQGMSVAQVHALAKASVAIAGIAYAGVPWPTWNTSEVSTDGGHITLTVRFEIPTADFRALPETGDTLDDLAADAIEGVYISLAVLEACRATGEPPISASIAAEAVNLIRRGESWTDALTLARCAVDLDSDPADDPAPPAHK